VPYKSQGWSPEKSFSFFSQFKMKNIHVTFENIPLIWLFNSYNVPTESVGRPLVTPKAMVAIPNNEYKYLRVIADKRNIKPESYN